MFGFSGTGTKPGLSISWGTESCICSYVCLYLAPLTSNTPWGSPLFLLVGALSSTWLPIFMKLEGTTRLWEGFISFLLV